MGLRATWKGHRKEFHKLQEKIMEITQPKQQTTEKVG